MLQLSEGLNCYLRFREPEAEDASPDDNSTCEGGSGDPSRFPSSLEQEETLNAPEVMALIEAWPQLSPDVRRSILAIVQASLGDG